MWDLLADNYSIPCGKEPNCNYTTNQACLLNGQGNNIECYNLPLSSNISGFRFLPSGSPPFYYVDSLTSDYNIIDEINYTQMTNLTFSNHTHWIDTKRKHKRQMDDDEWKGNKRSILENSNSNVPHYSSCHPFPTINDVHIFKIVFTFAMYHWKLSDLSISLTEKNLWMNSNLTSSSNNLPLGTFHNPLLLLGSCSGDYFCSVTTQVCQLKHPNGTSCVSSNQCMSGICGHTNSDLTSFGERASAISEGETTYCFGGIIVHDQKIGLTKVGENVTHVMIFPTSSNNSSLTESLSHTKAFKMGIGVGVGLGVLIGITLFLTYWIRRYLSKDGQPMSKKLFISYIFGRNKNFKRDYFKGDKQDKQSLVCEEGISDEMVQRNNIFSNSTSLITSQSISGTSTSLRRQNFPIFPYAPYTLLNMPTKPPTLSFHGSIREPSAPIIRAGNENGGSLNDIYYHMNHDTNDEENEIDYKIPNSTLDIKLNEKDSKDSNLLLVVSSSPEEDSNIFSSELEPSAPPILDTRTDIEPVVESNSKDAPPPYTPRSHYLS